MNETTPLQISDFPVGWATLVLAVATFAVALFAVLNFKEATKQGKALEDQAKAQREQTDAQIIPRISVYQGLPTELRQMQANILHKYAVVENATGRGPAMDVTVTVRNTTRNSETATHFDILNTGQDKGAGVPPSTTMRDRIVVNVRYKDITDREFERNAEFAYEGTTGVIIT